MYPFLYHGVSGCDGYQVSKETGIEMCIRDRCYSYHKLEENEQPHKIVQLLWCILLIILPIALVFSESSMNNLQSVSIVAAFPIGIVMILIVWSFLKDAKQYMEEVKKKEL